MKSRETVSVAMADPLFIKGLPAKCRLDAITVRLAQIEADYANDKAYLVRAKIEAQADVEMEEREIRRKKRGEV